MCVMENYVPWEKHPVEDCYHIYSDGTRVSVLFERDEDKVYGMNLIAVLAFKYHIRVYCDVVKRGPREHPSVRGRDEASAHAVFPPDASA